MNQNNTESRKIRRGGNIKQKKDKSGEGQIEMAGRCREGFEEIKEK
jgi:hypothetical protein